jgi:hypothetical protein
MFRSLRRQVQVPLRHVSAALAGLLFCSSLASAQILLNASTSPSDAQPGAVVSLEGKGWPATAVVPAANVQVTITPPAGSGLPVTVAAGSIGNTPGNTTGTDRTVRFAIPASLTTNSPLLCAVSITATTTSNVVLTSGAASALTIDPPPTVSTVSPSAATIGAAVALTVTGAYTHFSSNTAISLVSTSPAYTIAQTGSTTYNPANPGQVVASFTIPSGAPVGSYAVVAKTGTETASLPGGFLVSANGPASLFSITPNSLAAGQSTTVSVVGTNTNFAQGVTVAALGNNVTVGPVTVTDKTHASFQISIDPIAILGGRTLTVETNGEFATGTFTILANGSFLQSVALSEQSGSVASFKQGDNGTLTVTGSPTPPTHWIQAGTSVSLGGGINVGNITVTSPTSLTVNVSVGPGVVVGSYPVTVTTNGEVVTKANAVPVIAATPYLSNVSPTSAAQGQQHAIVNFTGVFTTFTKTTNGPLSANFGPNITVNSVTVTNGSDTAASADISIDNVAFTGGRTCTLSSNGTNYNFTFTVTPSGAALTGVAPGSGLQSSSVALTVAGAGTHWAQGLTSAALGTGITVNRVVVNPNSQASAEVDITIAANASLGSYPLTMSTGGEIVTLNNAFTVLPFTPSLTLFPSSGMIAVAPQTTNVINVNLSGNFTHFVPGTTIAAIDGNGVSIQNFNVLNKLQATAQLVIDQTAPSSPGTTVSPTASCTNQYGGNRIVTLETPLVSGGSEIVNAGFCVTSTPAVLTSISPFHSGEPAQHLAVTITGKSTHFESGVTTVGFGPDITVEQNSTNVVSNTVLTTVIDIAANAQLGWRPVFVNTIDPANFINEQLTIGFAIDAPSSASLLSVSPNTGIQGQSVTVQIAGNNTNWAQGSTTAIFGAGITVNSLIINNRTSATAQISIDPVNAPVGGSSVTMVTELGQGNEEIVSGPGFSVTQGISSINFICPNGATTVAQGCLSHQFQIHQGDITTLYVIGANTHWKDGETTLNFGSDIVVSQLKVLDALTIQCQIAASYTATTGFRGITATTNAETGPSFNDALNVLPLQAISVNITPTSAPQGTTFTMQVNGISTHWTSTAANPANNTTVTFGSNNGVNITAVNVISPTQMNLTVQVAGTAFIGLYTLTITTTGIPVSPNSPQGIEQMILTNAFSVSQGAAIITSVQPTSGTQSTTEALAVVGQNTNFQTGLTTAALSTGGCNPPSQAGINVSNVTASDHLHATVSIAVGANAPTGFQTLCMYTLGESVSYANAFKVLPATPTLNQVSPVTGQQGQTLIGVTLTGQFTTWQQGVTTVTFGQGISVQNLSIVNNTSATATLVISPTAYVGGRTTTVTTGNEIVSGNFFSVTPSAAILTTISPISANQGQHILLTINGNFTNWSQTLTQFAISGGGADITINGVVINSATQATADLSISPTANLGTRSIYMSTIGENVNLQNGLLITGGIPSISSIGPGRGTRGDVGDNITISGIFTDKVPWSANSTVDFGDPCITVAPIGAPSGSTFNSQFSITAVINIGAGNSACPATLGLHTVSVRSGTSVQTGQFTVYDPAAPPSPYISYESPSVALAGQTLAVTLVGAFTNWLPGQTTVSFGAGITLNRLDITSLTTAVANITIDPAATVAPRTLTVTTGAQQLTTTFTITVGTPAITLVTANSAIQGETRLIDLVGQYTSWTSTGPNPTQFTFCSGVDTVQNLQIFGPTAARVEVTIDQLAAVGSCPITATTGAEIAHLASPASFSITQSTAVISSITPNTALQGASLAVQVTGFATHWLSSTPSFAFSCGSTTVTQVAVTDNTHASFNLVLGLYAPPGSCSLTATLGGEVATLNNAFVIQPGTPILLSASNGSNRQQSQFSIGILGQYTLWTNVNTTVTFPSGGVTGVVVNVTGQQSITVTGTVQPLAFTGCGPIVVTTTGQNPPVLTLPNAFCITPGPAAITQLSPNSLGQGGSTTVQITGTNTNWQQGVTGTFNFGQGITVTSQSITSATTAVAAISVAANALPQANSVTVSTLGETATDPAAFTIFAATPTLVDVFPKTGAQAQAAFIVNVTGAFTHFSPSTTASYGDFSATVAYNTGTTLTLTVAIPPTAPVGERTLTITTPTSPTTQEVVALANAMNVTAGPATVSSVAPNNARRGSTSVQLLITGSATHFDTTTQAAFSGGGITQVGPAAPVANSNGLQANITVNIDASAAVSTRNITMTTGGEVATLANAFTVNAALLSLGAASPPFGTTNVFYSQSLSISGGLAPFNFTISNGSLPSNLTLNAASGLISGAPTGPANATFTVKVTDNSGQSADATYTLNIYDPLTITTTSLSAGVSGILYTQNVTAAGGAAPRTFALHAGTLPPNVTIDLNSGAINGTPTTTGTFTPTIRVTDNVGQFVDKQFSIIIYGVLTITTPSLNEGRKTFAYNQSINTTGGAPTVTLSLSQGPLPSGITLTGNALSGTPTQAGTFPIQIKMTDGLGNAATHDYSLTIDDTLTITTTTLPNGVVGVPYSQTIATNFGVGQVNFAITSGTLPTSLTLDPGTGLLHGTPSAQGSFTFTVGATDTLPITTLQSYTVVIAPPPLITNISPNTLSVGQTATIALTGQDTHWDNTTTADFGPGVTVNLVGGVPVTVTGPTSVSVNVTIQQGAAGGTRNVTLTTPDAGNEVANLNAGQTFTVVAGPPTILSLSPPGAKKNTNASVTVTGQNLLGATFQFANPIPNLTNVPGPITIASNDGSTVVLKFPTGSAEGQYALTATTGVGVSPVTPATQFVVQPSGLQTVESPVVSVLNISNNWNPLVTLPPGRNSFESNAVSVLNISNNWDPFVTLPAGRNSVESNAVSVLNVSNPNWNALVVLPPGRNSVESNAVSVLNSLWNNSNNYVLAAGRNAVTGLPVSVCAPPQCTVNQSMFTVTLITRNQAQPVTTQSAAPQIATGAPAKRPAAPHLDPVEQLPAVVEGRTLRLNVEVDPAETAIVRYEVNGIVIARTTQAPHEMLFTVPVGVPKLDFRAMVELPSGELRSSSLVRLPVVEDASIPVESTKLGKDENATLYGAGLKSEFFTFNKVLVERPSLDGITPQSTGYVTAINQPNPDEVFGNDPLGAGVSHDFAIRYSGEVWAENDGSYAFWLTAKSGAELRIDGKPVSASVDLEHGWHKIEVDYFLAVGAESLKLEWQAPGDARRVVGPDTLRTPLKGGAVPLKFDSVWFEIQQSGKPARFVLARQQQ